MSTTDFGNPDVIVVGAGNAACCAALAARENGASVIVLEAAPIEDSGGNSRYTGGLMRVVYNNVEDVAQLIPDLTEEEKKTHDYGSYTADQYFDDMGRITQYMSDPDLTEILITKSFETLVWLRKKGVRFQASYGRQSYKVEGGAYKFWGGLVAETWGGGAGPRRQRAQGVRARRHQDLLRDARALPHHRRWRHRDRRHGEAQGTQRRHPLQGGRARLRRLRIERRDARALSRSRLGPRESARHALQPGRRHPDGARHRRDALTVTGRAATPSAGTATRRPSATSTSATSSRSTATRGAS